MEMKNTRLIYLRPTQLIYLRETGPYSESIPKAWRRLIDWLDMNGLIKPVGRGYGLAFDNPADVSPGACRYDAAVEMMPELTGQALSELGIATLPGGPYACWRVSGDYTNMRTIMGSIHRDFVPMGGLDVDVNRPIISIYLDNPSRHHASELRADVCVPVRTSAEFGTAAE